MYIRVLVEPFSAAEVIEIEADKRFSSCAMKAKRETALRPERATRRRSLALSVEPKR